MCNLSIYRILDGISNQVSDKVSLDVCLNIEQYLLVSVFHLLDMLVPLMAALPHHVFRVFLHVHILA